jgi:hypothetical protein
MAELYAKLIKAGRRTLDGVPERYREAVSELLRRGL